MNPFWNFCIEQLGAELPAQQFSTWIRPLQLVEGKNDRGEVAIAAPNRFILKWVRDNYLGIFQRLAEEFYKEPVSVILSVGAAVAAADLPKRSAPPVETQIAAKPAPTFKTEDVRESAAVQTAARKTAGSLNGQGTRLMPHFTFDSLVVGKANELARAACLNVAQSPGGAYNPLFIYGGAGLGKTHLIHAIGNAVLAADPTKVVRYVHAEDYYSDVVRAYQQKAFDSFKRNYRSLDLLLLDDVQ